MVWPQGKNLKPQPKGRAPVQPIPGPKPRKTPAEKRKDQEYRLALSKGHYPRGELLEPLALSPCQLAMPSVEYLQLMEVRQELVETFFLTPEQMGAKPTSSSTVAMVAAPRMTAAQLAALANLMVAPAPSREPIEVTEAEYQALVKTASASQISAQTPEMLMSSQRTYRGAVFVVKPEPAPLEGEILPPEPVSVSISNDMVFLSNPPLDPRLEEMWERHRERIQNASDAMMVAAITGGWKV
ncbi:hypothetical protein PWG15_05365 [Ensifer adhaerens]|uniref:hypothetical protein n=1 Tax=Ensifer adhaerens TaxID=106592 RepID=UPI0023A99230|nr:hypothetical protein [Ensifer adhaerens]WDZ77933.1 hypothetical protein PWG15_05365 [Ensifer adhaerens]